MKHIFPIKTKDTTYKNGIIKYMKKKKTKSRTIYTCKKVIKRSNNVLGILSNRNK